MNVSTVKIEAKPFLTKIEVKPFCFPPEKTRIMNKSVPTVSTDHSEEPLELENHFILRLPEDAASDVRKWLQEGGSHFKDKLQINFNPDMRHAQIKVEKEIFNGTLMDLPCIIETLKTVDKKNFYKVADVSQILICKRGDDSKSPIKDVQQKSGEHLPGENTKKKDKQFQFPHGITPPLKNVRKRRFRKTLKKKYMDAPELEKELKRLLRADLEAEKIRYEVVTIEQDAKQQKSVVKLEQHDVAQTNESSNLIADLSEGSNQIREDELFGAALSSSSDENDFDDDDETAEGRELAQQLMMTSRDEANDT